MCGIAGSVNINNININNIHLSMAHRGPDSKGSLIDNNISIIHNRLSIQDLSENASQPMTLNDHVIVLNGEIYNHMELRKKISDYKFRSHSDTETLLCLFIKYGINCLQELDGMFAFAIFHKPTRKLFFGRDRAGKKPLYYYKNNENFFFASELETIRKNISLKINEEHINAFLRMGFFYKQQTPFKNVHELPAGSYACLDTKTMDLDINKWWSITSFYKSKSLIIDKEQVIDQIDHYLNLAVKRRLDSSDLEVGSFLSGGIDSGLVTAIAAHHKRNLKTFTISFNGQFDESLLAQSVADKYDLDHTTINIDYNNLLNDIERILINYGEPFADSSAIPSYYVSKEAKKYLTVILNGDGGDELFGGYRRYIPFSKINFFHLNPALKKLLKIISGFMYHPPNKMSLYNYIYRLFSLGGKESLIETYLSSTNDIFEGYLDCFFEKDYGLQTIISDLEYNKISISDGLKSIMDMDFNTLLCGDLLVKMDIATMSNGLEGRSPFLSKELLEYAPQIPTRYKVSNTNTKYILRELSKKYLPLDLVNQPKRGFEIPLKDWVNNQLSEIISDYLNPAQFSSTFIDHKFINNMLNNQISMPSEKRAKILWSLFTLEVWYKNYKMTSI